MGTLLQNEIKYKKIYLNDTANAYIKEILRNGHTLAKLLLKDIDFDLGSVYTVLPSYISEKASNSFFEGGKIKINPEEINYVSLNSITSDSSEEVTKVAKLLIKKNIDTSIAQISPVQNTNLLLISEIQEFLKKDSTNICLFENGLAKSSDTWLKSSESELLFLNDEVYHVVGKNIRTDNGKILTTLNEAKNAFPPIIGILTRVEHLDLKKKNISESYLKSLVNNTVKVIVGAYDREGYLIWENK